jgi:short-subunit dehydrogenase
MVAKGEAHLTFDIFPEAPLNYELETPEREELQMPSITIFGAGPGLGRSTAVRFAREDFEISLVGRNPETIDALAAELRDGGTTVRTVLGDLADPRQAVAALDELVASSGTPDVVVYAPGDVSRLPVDAGALDAETLRSWLPLNLLTPVELAHAVVPAMAERGSGTFLVAQGMSAREPVPAMASTGVAQAGLLYYLHALAAEFEPRGVRVASLLISRLIERSAAAALFDSGHFGEIASDAMPRVHPDDLADQIRAIAEGAEGVEHRA